MEDETRLPGINAEQEAYIKDLQPEEGQPKAEQPEKGQPAEGHPEKEQEITAMPAESQKAEADREEEDDPRRRIRRPLYAFAALYLIHLSWNLFRSWRAGEAAGTAGNIIAPAAAVLFIAAAAALLYYSFRKR